MLIIAKMTTCIINGTPKAPHIAATTAPIENNMKQKLLVKTSIANVKIAIINQNTADPILSPPPILLY